MNPDFASKDAFMCGTSKVDELDATRLEDFDKRDIRGGEDGRSMSEDGSPEDITKDELFALLLRSQQPDSDALIEWLSEKVLPEIRRTGKYTGSREVLNTIAKRHEKKQKSLGSQRRAANQR